MKTLSSRHNFCESRQERENRKHCTHHRRASLLHRGKSWPQLRIKRRSFDHCLLWDARSASKIRRMQRRESVQGQHRQPRLRCRAECRSTPLSEPFVAIHRLRRCSALRTWALDTACASKKRWEPRYV